MPKVFIEDYEDDFLDNDDFSTKVKMKKKNNGGAREKKGVERRQQRNYKRKEHEQLEKDYERERN